MQPSDSSSPSASALVPLALAYLDADAISSRLARCIRCRSRLGDGSPAPRVAGFLQGETRSPRFLGRPCLARREPITTPSAASSSPGYRGGCLGLQGYSSLGHSVHPLFSGLPRRGSRSRMPTHRRPRHRGRRKACFRVAWVDLLGRDSRPLDDITEFQKLSHLFLLSDQPFLVATSTERVETRGIPGSFTTEMG